MSTITTRAGKGSPLTNNELDANFTNLNTDKYQSGDSPSFATIGVSGNLAFSGTGNRITGDFSNATVANRVAFQSSTTNGVTSIGILPNGTSTQSQIVLEGDSALTNGSTLTLVTGANSNTEARIAAGIRGTGTYLSLTMYTGGSERLRIDTSGNVGIGTSSPGTKLHVVGNGIKSSTSITIGDSVGGNYEAGSIYADTNWGMILRSRTASPAGGAAFAFMQANNTESMRIDTAGNVGIGTASTAAEGLVIARASSAATLYRGAGTTNTGEFYIGHGSAAEGYIFNRSNKEIIFGTNNTERMRIDSLGRVGIGTSSPDYKFVVEGNGTDERVYIRNTNGSSLGNQYFIVSANTSRNLTMFVPGSANSYSNQFQYPLLESATTLNLSGVSDIRFFTQNTNRMIIDSSGNVGIGTSTIGSGLSFGGRYIGNNGYANAIRVYDEGAASTSTTSNSYGFGFISNGILSYTAGTGGTHAWFTSNTERMRIDSSGNVGIGEINTSRARFTVGNDQADGNQTIANSGILFSSNGGTIGGGRWGQAAIYPIGTAGFSGNLVFATAGSGSGIYVPPTERMRITSAGLVGINTTTPDTRLDVSSSTADELTSVFTKGLSDSNFRVGFMNGVSGSTGSIQGRMGLFYLGVGEAASVRFVRGGTTTDSSLVFATNGTERLRVPSDAGGLTFPATQAASSDANTLDDYEEGTFTPTVFGGTTAGTTTYTIQTGNYTKIGRVVTATVKVQYSAATGTGTLSIGNFPFTAASGEHVGSVMEDNLDMPGNASYALYLQASTNSAQIYVSSDNGGVAGTQLSNESATIWATITYFTS